MTLQRILAVVVVLHFCSLLAISHTVLAFPYCWGAASSVVSDGSDGILVPVDDPSSLGLALLRLLKSPDLRHRLGQAGREKVLHRYTWEIVTALWREVYERVLNKRG